MLLARQRAGIDDRARHAVTRRSPRPLPVTTLSLRLPPAHERRCDALDPRLRRRFTLGILLWSVATGFFRLGAAPVYVNNEAREGVYVRAMLDTGDWILPQVPNHVENGEIVPDKPPLFHWISASVAWIRTAFTTRSMPTGGEVSRCFDE